MANFITKKVKSQYLDREFEVSCWEMGEDGRKLTIIEHAAFEDIIFNELAEEPLKFEYDLIPIPGVAKYPAMKCVMKDDSGRCIIALGEAHPDSLVNNISRQNPVIMAGNRAFDRAAIRYLNLEGKVYSSDEIPSEEDVVETKTEPTKTEEPDVVVESKKAPDYSNVIISFGKYRTDNKTVAEVWANDEKWAETIIAMDLNNCGETTRRQINALKKFKENKGV